MEARATPAPVTDTRWIQRTAAACGLAALLALALWFDRCFPSGAGLGLHLLFLLGTLLALREVYALCRAAGLEVFEGWGLAAAAGLTLTHYAAMWLVAGGGWPSARAIDLLRAALAFAMLSLFYRAARGGPSPACLRALCGTAFGLLYLWYLPAFFLALPYLGTDGALFGPSWSAHGWRWVLALIVIAKGCDVFALAVGACFGRRHVFPKLSPGKTLEGYLAGALGSVLLAALLRWEAVSVLPANLFGWGETLLLGLALGLAGMAGDLSASLLKRSAGVKDASSQIPGFGGVLDVVDSLVVAAPVAWLLFPACLAW
jgi:phosphatidate cytidylyltransferase